MREQKGITLVALIITIIVLLILAVVTIQSVNNQGIIQHAKDSANRFDEEQEKEKVQLAAYEAVLIGSGIIQETGLTNALNSQFEENNWQYVEKNSQYFKIKINDLGRVYTISKNGGISKDDEVSITLDKTSVSCQLSEENITLTATLNNAVEDGTTQWVWTNSNESAAQIQDGENARTKTIKLLAEGTATITVAYGEYTATCTITITEGEIVESVVGAYYALDSQEQIELKEDNTFTMKTRVSEILSDKSGTYEFDSTTNIVTITISATSGSDKVKECNYYRVGTNKILLIIDEYTDSTTGETTVDTLMLSTNGLNGISMENSTYIDSTGTYKAIVENNVLKVYQVADNASVDIGSYTNVFVINNTMYLADSKGWCMAAFTISADGNTLTGISGVFSGLVCTKQVSE